eukprot:860143-Amphidinium_carterae.1
MTDPAFQANATAASFTQQLSSQFETSMRKAVSMAREKRDQLSAQVVQLQQQLAAQQQLQAVCVPILRGHIKLHFKLGRPPARAGKGKNWEEFAFKLVAHTATLSSNASAFLRS